MRKIVYRIVVFVTFLSVAPMPAFAAVGTQPLCPTGSFGPLCNLKPQNAGGALGAFLAILLILAALISLFFLIWGGVRYILSGGDKGKIDAARGTLIAAIVGLIISFISFFVVSFILYFFTGQGLTNLSIPTLTQ